MNADLDLALRLADAADAVTLPRFRAADLRVDRKPDRTPVTDADLAAEDALRALIALERPDDAVVGEERGGELGRRGAGLGAGSDRRHQELLPRPRGVGFADRADRARRAGGRGGQRAGAGPALVGGARGRRLDQRRARRDTAPDRGVRGRRAGRRLPLDHRLPALRAARATARRYLELAAACWETRAFGDFWQYCLVAEGVIDLAVDPVANPWDLAAVLPIVTEAGGAFTDLAGAARFDGGNGLASNGAAARRRAGDHRDAAVTGRLGLRRLHPGPGVRAGHRAWSTGTRCWPSPAASTRSRSTSTRQAAAGSIFGGLAASGWFTAGLWMRAYVDGVLARADGLGSPGGDEIAWPAPVFAGDELRASMEVLAARRSRSRADLGLVTLRALLHRVDERPADVLVFTATFTGMFRA